MPKRSAQKKTKTKRKKATGKIKKKTAPENKAVKPEETKGNVGPTSETAERSSEGEFNDDGESIQSIEDNNAEGEAGNEFDNENLEPDDEVRS